MIAKIVFIWMLLMFVRCNEAVNILGIFSFPTRSHSMISETIMTELSRRGHNVTVITNFPVMNQIENYTEIIIQPAFDYWKAATHIGTSLFDLEEASLATFLRVFYEIGFASTKYSLEHENVQQFLKNNDNHFDLVICEHFYQEPFILLGYKYKSPIILIATQGHESYMSEMIGGITPWAHVPHGYLDYNNPMTFSERLNNAYAYLYESYSRRKQYLPRMNQLAQDYLSQSITNGPIPQIEACERNISIILINDNIGLSTPRPLVPAIIQIGGAHIKPPQQLVTDMRKFLDDAIHGAIYFSLGTNLRSADIPDQQMAALIHTFSKIKQKVLWKFENDRIPNLPKNVMIKKWMPQNDILAHPHVRVFITHGGLLSIQEAIFRGVPMIGIPIYGHQHLNMKKAVKGGFAISLKFNNITNSSLPWAINELMQNPVYSEKMFLASKIFRDHPNRALDDAMYWIEYVLKHNGALHMRSSALDITWSSYFMLDIIFGLILIVIFSFVAVVLCILFVIKRKKSKKIAKKLL